MPKCLNCNAKVESNYCPECGQSIKTRKVDNKTIFVDVPFSIINIDTGFGYTLMQVLKRPVQTAKDYIDGKKMNHFRPVSFLLVLTSLSYLINKLIPREEVKMVHLDSQKGEKITKFLTETPQLIVLMSLPVLALSMYTAFRKRKESFAAHFYYITYMQSFIAIITFIPNLIFGNNMYYAAATLLLGVIANIVYYVFVYKDDYKIHTSILRGILAQIYTLLIFLVLFAIVIMIATVYMKISGVEQL